MKRHKPCPTSGHSENNVTRRHSSSPPVSNVAVHAHNGKGEDVTQSASKSESERQERRDASFTGLGFVSVLLYTLGGKKKQWMARHGPEWRAVSD